MVIKGSARGGPGELAAHLLRADTNERVRVMEFYGVAADDLRSALLEMDGMGAGSRSRRTLYHASINTPTSELMTPAMQQHARERLAAELGLTGQPYAMVEHVKNGRQHTHVVWSRIDSETGRAVPDSHNYRRHELVSRELERDFLHERVLGAHVRDKETQPRPQRGPTWGEQRQAERSGMSPQQAKRVVTQCWQETRTGREFRSRVEVEGFQLARGDKRDFVLVDAAGEIHGLTRRIEGVKAAEVRTRLADIDPAELPTIEEARQRHAERWRREQQAVETAQAKQEEENRQRTRQQARQQGNERVGSPLSGVDRDVADALRSLNKTMRAEVEKTIVSKPMQPPRAAEPSQPVNTGSVRTPSEQKPAQPSSQPSPQPKPKQPGPTQPAAQPKPEERRPEPRRRTPEDDLRDFLNRPGNDLGRNFEPER